MTCPHKSQWRTIVVFRGRNCADLSFPGVYSRLSSGYDWIRTAVCLESVAPPSYLNCPASRTVDGQCSFGTADIPLASGLVMRQLIDPRSNTLSIQMEYTGSAWLGFAFSPSGQMVGNTAVIGLPDSTSNPVDFYNLGGKSVAEVTLSTTNRVLTDATINQAGGSTILSFTMPVSVNGQAQVVNGQSSKIIYAVGSSNDLAYHAVRGSTDVVFTNCAVTTPPPPTPPSPTPPTPTPPTLPAPTPTPPAPTPTPPAPTPTPPAPTPTRPAPTPTPPAPTPTPPTVPTPPTPTPPAPAPVTPSPPGVPPKKVPPADDVSKTDSKLFNPDAGRGGLTRFRALRKVKGV
jgi:hypothetical protein